MPRACKGLSLSRGLGSICYGVHAVRAELNTGPVDTLGISKADAGAHTCQNGPQEEAGAEASACVAYGLLPSDRECHGSESPPSYLWG